MSSKQLARTVMHGRKVTFRFPSGEQIEGYLCGMDDFHYMVATSQGQKHLIHKSGAIIITLADESSYEEEPLKTVLERVVGPFREYVDRAFFGRTNGSPASDRKGK